MGDDGIVSTFSISEAILHSNNYNIFKMFCDKVTVKLTAGKGGDGLVSFLHALNKEYGGPDGGDGGRGGDIYLVSSSNVNTLYEYKTRRHLRAENGTNGKKNKRRGAFGEDLRVKVPVGTIVYDQTTGRKLMDLSLAGQEFLAAKGGEGGFGNAHFVSSTRQAPQVAELGEKREEKTIRLELKLIADVGLIGLPNVGKSTLLSVVSAAKPKIADYPFTTLIPNLGVVDGAKFGIRGLSFVIADIPGLIEGASKGKGLGDEFLRHVERTRVLVHIIDSVSADFVKDFNDINKELELFNKDLVQKPQVIVLSKADLGQDFSGNLKKLESHIKKVKAVKTINRKPIIISAPTHKGIKELMALVAQTLRKLQPIEEKTEKEEYKVFTPEDLVGERFSVVKADSKFVISGKKIERFARKTDFKNKHSLERLLDIMNKMGILKELERQGANAGSEIEIGEKKFKI